MNTTNSTSNEKTLWQEVIETATKDGIIKTEQEANDICKKQQPHPGYGCISETCPLNKYCPCGN